MTMPEIPPGHITVNEAIQISSYSRGYVYILLRDKKIKSMQMKFGRMRVFLIDKQSLIDFMVSNGRSIVDAQAV